MFIKTKLQVEIPSSAILNNKWQFPYANQQFNKHYAPLFTTLSNIKVVDIVVNNLKEVDYVVNVLLLVLPENWGTMLAIDLLGNIYINIDKNTDKENMETILSLIPDLWKWGKRTREKQDNLIEQIKNKLNLPKLILQESQRENFNYAEYNQILQLYKTVENILTSDFQNLTNYKHVIEYLENTYRNYNNLSIISMQKATNAQFARIEHIRIQSIANLSTHYMK